MKKADLVLCNGQVYSISLDNKERTGQSIAVQDGRIVKIGTDDELSAYIGTDTEVIDCKGHTVLPGLCDAHCHPSIAAGVYAGCDLFGIYIQAGETREQIIGRYMERLKRFIEGNPQLELVRGTGWVVGNFLAERMPTREDIDQICDDRPVILESFCQHNLWVNTKALEAAGIDENTSDVYAGDILRDADGYPTGIFREPEAMNLIKENIPGYDFSVEKYKEALLYYQKEFANKYGVTLIQDCMHSDHAREAYAELAKEGKLTLRARGVYLLQPKDFEKQLDGFIARKGEDNVGDDFRIDTVKIFAEGEFVLLKSYEKEFLEECGLPDGYTGTPYWQDEELISAAARAMEAGFSVHIHAMGDGSVKQSVHCLAQAQKRAGKKGRNVVAHLMLADSESVREMSEAGIIANCQPRWMVYDSDIAGMIPMVGKMRAEAAYPLRAFLEENVTVAFGTDFPVTPPPNTMHEIQCAMTRRVFPDAPDYERFKDKILGNEQPATLQEAVKALSLSGACQMFLEHETGSIEEGKSADLVILDSSLEEMPPEEIYTIHTEKTIFKGNVVYEK